MKIVDNLLCHNNYSRPGMAISKIRGVVIHWVANPNTSATANRNFFNNRRDGKSGYGSAHYIIDLDGTIVRCIPDNEIAYHVGANEYKTNALGSYPNDCTIGIECTHLDWNGVMTPATYDALLLLCKDLCDRYNLNPLIDLYLHYHVTGKDCHRWFLKNPAEWDRFKQLVKEEHQVEKVKINLNGVIKEVDAVVVEGSNYIKLQDLRDSKLEIGYDAAAKTPVVKVKG